jgi:hypothetical protein
MKRILIAALALSLAACATAPTLYQPAVGPQAVGYSDYRIEPGGSYLAATKETVRRLVGAGVQACGFAPPALPGRQGAEAGLMDEGTERPGLFAKGGVGRFVLVLAMGAIVLAALVCGLGTVITGAVVVQGGKHYLENHDDELEGATNEGIAFAAGRTITERVQEAQHRAASCTSLMSTCAMPIGMFVASCTRAADDDGYCTTVPAAADISTREWKKSSCAGSAGGVWCEAVMGMVQMGCEERKKKDTTSDVETEGAPDPQ